MALLMRCVFSLSMMQSRMKAVAISTSTAGTRPGISARGIRRCETTARSTAASCRRTCFCWCGGYTAMMRLIVSVASSVWSVENTRWPVSAASSAVSIVSKSRISPTRMTSGSWRSALRSACANERGVDRHLALVHDRPAVAVEELDGILDRHHVRAARAVDVVDHRRQRRALAAAGGAGHEHEAALFVRDPAEHRRQQQVVDRQDFRRNDAQHHAHRAALLEDVDAEAAEPRDAVREVDFLRLDELVTLLGRHHLRAHRQRVFVHQPLFFADRHEHAGRCAPSDRRRP